MPIVMGSVSRFLKEKRKAALTPATAAVITDDVCAILDSWHKAEYKGVFQEDKF